MAKQVFTHLEDDGDLSVFAEGDLIVLACEHGHYWVINAEQHSKATVKPALEEALPEDRADSLLDSL